MVNYCYIKIKGVTFLEEIMKTSLLFTIILLLISALIVAVLALILQKISASHNTTANTDHITGLLNRFDGERLIKSAITEQPGCLAFIDLDNLKPINDTFGHLAGDHAIKVVSEVLTAHGQDSIISRIGGDEFLFYMMDVDEGKATFIINCIMDAFRKKKENDKYLNFASLSIGLCLSTPECSYDDIYQKADKALYFIKQNGKDGYYFYHQAFSGADTHPSIDLARLVESIRKQASYSGALGVEYREFTHIYEFITNLATRYDHNLQLVLITMNPYNSDSVSLTPEMMEDGMNAMNSAIRSSLRTVDVCTRFSNKQFLVILTYAETESIDKIINRIYTKFYELYNDSNFTFSYEAANLLEPEDN